MAVSVPVIYCGPVLRRIFATGRQSSCTPTVAAGSESVLVQPVHSLHHLRLRTTSVLARQHRLLIDYYKTNIEYEKNRV